MTDRKNLCVSIAPDWKGRPEAFPERAIPPAQWMGMTVQWDAAYTAYPVFIGQFDMLCGNDIYLFGARFELSKATVREKVLSGGFFIGYLLLEWSRGEWTTHILLQSKSITFSSCSEKKDYVDADSLGAKQIKELSLGGRPPKWKSHDANWPTISGMPMKFVGQSTLIENEVTRSCLTWDDVVFVFWNGDVETSEFKIVTQELDYQSAEEHYRHE